MCFGDETTSTEEENLVMSPLDLRFIYGGKSVEKILESNRNGLLALS